MSISPVENAAALRILLGNTIRAAESVQPDNPFGDIGHPANADALAEAGLREFDTENARAIIAGIDDAIANGKNDILLNLVAAVPTLFDPGTLIAKLTKALAA